MRAGKGECALRLRDLREDHDLTQTELARHLHIRQSTYSQYENGQRQIPLESLMKLSLYYHTSVDYILELTDETIPYPPAKRMKNTRDV